MAPHAPDEVPDSDELPAPHGLGGHLRYSLASLRLLHRLQSRLDELDDELRGAVATRDSRLLDLAEAGLGLRLQGLAASFAKTIRELSDQAASVEAQLSTTSEERSAAEAHLREALEAVDARRDALREAQQPILERVEAARVELAGARAEESPQPDSIAALEGELASLEPQIERAEEQAANLAEERESLRLDSAERIEDLGEELRRAEEQLARVTARVRAARIDLGRELIHHAPPPGLDSAHRAARRILEHIETLRDRRAALLRRRDRFDGGPLRRTLSVLLVVGVVGLMLWWWL